MNIKCGCQILEDASALEDLADQWHDLATRALPHAMCQTYEYCRAAVEVDLDLGCCIWLLTVRDGERLVGVWLIEAAKEGLVRFLWPLGSGGNDEYSGPLVQTDEAEQILGHIFGRVAELPGDVWQVFAVPEGSVIAGVLEERRRAGRAEAPRPWVRYKLIFGAVKSWQDFLAGKSQNLRAKLRRDARRLGERGVVERGWCRTVEDADTVIDWIFVHKNQWLHDRAFKAGRFFGGRVQRFFKVLARRVDLATVPIVAFVKVDGVPIAACLNVVDESTIEYVMPALDPVWSHYAPGVLLVEFCAQTALGTGRDFDFRMLQADYKDRWANRSETVLTYTFPLSWRGRLYGIRRVIQSLRVRFGPWLRPIRRRIARLQANWRE